MCNCSDYSVSGHVPVRVKLLLIILFRLMNISDLHMFTAFT